MINQINGLHHVTSLASAAQSNNDFFTNASACAGSRRPSTSTRRRSITCITATRSARPVR